jgi:MoxR-like ATPase
MATPLERLQGALGAAVVGQDAAVADVLTALLARGHVLLEGVPGVAKTLLARTLARALGMSFTRVQFTPDLMPSDLLGTSVFHAQAQAFQLHKGPVFTELLVADEINRTPPKTQAALLEAMEERQVTLDGQTHSLSDGFFVVATQNPLELEGTWPLPEAQLDRFLMRVRVGYPSEAAELEMLSGWHARGSTPPALSPVLAPGELAALQGASAAVKADPSVLAYVVQLVQATRRHPRVKLGASPRAAQGLLGAARARAVLGGESFVTPDDVKAVALPVLNHRLLLHPEAEVEGVTADDVLAETLDRVPVPR